MLPFGTGVIASGVLVWGMTYYAFSHSQPQSFPRASMVSLDRLVPFDSSAKPLVGKQGRSVAQLLALSDSQLEKVDVVELNLAVAREIPGLENLDVKKYSHLVDQMAAVIAKKLPADEKIFHKTPEKWNNNLHLFRLGQVAGFLDQGCGIAYIEEQKHVKAIRYTNPKDLFLNGLLETKRGTCGNMPTLHIAIGRRLGWPVSLASLDAHTVCRFDNGKTVLNLEATDTGRGGFAVEGDEEFAKRFDISDLAIDCGSDLRSMTAREMLGYFISLRARHYADTDRLGLADVDYSLARSLIPNHRRTYKAAVQMLVGKGDWLFAPGEVGHPITLANAIHEDYLAASQPSLLPTHPIDIDPSYYYKKRLREEEANRRRIEQTNRLNAQLFSSPQQPRGDEYSPYPSQLNPTQLNPSSPNAWP